jgi:chromosome segregation ATPase
MSEEQMQNLDDGRSFEERVFARFDAIDAGLRDLSARVQSLETRVESLEAESQRRAVETKPIWERALKEIVDTRKELTETRREVTRRLDRIESVTLETRSRLGEAEDRIDRLESAR